MNKLKLRFIPYALITALLLASCAAAGTDTDAGSSPAASQGGASSGSSAASSQNSPAGTASASGKVESEDLDAGWDEGAATKIALNGSSIDVSGGGASADGSTVTITSAGTFVVNGTLADGQIAVKAPEAALVRLVLNGADISSSTTSPIFCEQADKLLIILADGSENTITDSGSYVFPDASTDEPNAALFSKEDLTINGSGSLTVNANYNNGIGTKDDLVIVSGTFIVTAPNNAIRGRDSVTVLDGNFTLDAGNDGVQSNNDADADKGWIGLYGGVFDITAAHDGFQAETRLTAEGGDFSIVTGGGSANAPQRAANTREGGMPGGVNPFQGGGDGGQMPPAASNTSAAGTASVENALANTAVEAADSAEEAASDSFKGMKAGADLTITGGSFVLDSADDALHANGNVSVSGGEFTISTGDDGIHADGDLVISGNPRIDILTSYEGIEGATVTISGGDIGVVAGDDGINAAGGAGGSEGGAFGQDRFKGSSGEYWIRVEGGTINITAGTDGIDSNGDLFISGGSITFSMTNLQAAGGDGMLDKDGQMAITGGIILGAGGNGIVSMGPAMGGDASTQPILQLFYSAGQSAGTPVELKDAAGSIVASFTPERDFKCVIVSAPELEDGQSYTVYTGGAKTLELTLSGSVTSLQDTGEAAAAAVGGRGGGAGRGERPALPSGNS